MHFPVPASMLQARAREKEFEIQQAAIQSGWPFNTGYQLVSEQIGWGDILAEYEFPEMYSWEMDQAPPELMEQLIGQRIGFGMKVNYGGKVCLVVDMDIRLDELGQQLTGEHLDAYWRPITIVPIHYIDLTR